MRKERGVELPSFNYVSETPPLKDVKGKKIVYDGDTVLNHIAFRLEENTDAVEQQQFDPEVKSIFGYDENEDNMNLDAIIVQFFELPEQKKI